ncbi:hypothetical protein NP493_705g03034 [Ridgeia piscesae]|uniref:Uncharacterized protein n=1 Tax=Ridgeia piscesae TaxID=27915 RepID=A0AAD9KR74_RIDPI|nr:hypothetical protein NP493_705g03034 [Ridgeia piscesae]
MRYKGKQCPAGISQRGDTFTLGQFDHIHPLEPNRVTLKKVTCQIRDAATERPYDSAARIVNDILLETPDSDFISPMQQANLTRMVNRFRQQQYANQ